jgi:LysM repeat protein
MIVVSNDEANQAISIAVKALRNGDKNTARRYASKAAYLTPNLEYAWLVLAEVSTLKSRIEYLEQAIRINPGRASSHEDLRLTLEKIDNLDNQGSTFSPSPKNKIDQPIKKKINPIFSMPILFLSSIIIGLLLWGWLGDTRSAMAAILPESMIRNSEIPETWGGVNIQKPTQTPTATATQTSIPTLTSTIIPTTIIQMPTQIIQNTSNPDSVQITGDRYIVQSGDTLFKISQKLGVRLDDLATVNSISPQAIIYIGQSLVIPKPGYVSISSPIPDLSLTPEISDKYILVDISEQHLYAYESELLVYSFIASTGMNNATRIGFFSVLDKIPNAYGATWNIWMPNWLGIYWAGTLENGIHALPILSNGLRLWDGYLGTPISYGCIVLGVNESQMLYDWVTVGTPVEIQW